MNPKLSLTLDQLNEMGDILSNEILSYEEHDDTDSVRYRLAVQIQGRITTSLKKYYKKVEN